MSIDSLSSSYKTLSKASNGLSFNPADATVEKLGRAGGAVTKRIAETFGPRILAQGCIAGTVAVLQNVRAGRLVGALAAPLLVPLMTPVVAYAVGTGVSCAIILAANFAKEALEEDKIKETETPELEEESAEEKKAPKKAASKDGRNGLDATLDKVRAEIPKEQESKVQKYGEMVVKTYGPGVVVDQCVRGMVKVVNDVAIGTLLGNIVAPLITPIVVPSLAYVSGLFFAKAAEILGSNEEKQKVE